MGPFSFPALEIFLEAPQLHHRSGSTAPSSTDKEAAAQLPVLHRENFAEPGFELMRPDFLSPPESATSCCCPGASPLSRTSTSPSQAQQDSPVPWSQAGPGFPSAAGCSDPRRHRGLLRDSVTVPRTPSCCCPGPAGLASVPSAASVFHLVPFLMHDQDRHLMELISSSHVFN